MNDEKKITHHYAGILLITSDGKLIGQQRDDNPNIDNPNKVATFGGTTEEGEDYRHAAWRELVQEETNLKTPEASLKLFWEDTSWRILTKEWEARHFYLVKISDDELANLEVYEGKGWVKIDDENDPRLVDEWRTIIKAYYCKTD